MIVLSLLLAAAVHAPVAAPHPIRHAVHRRAARHVARRNSRLGARLRLTGCGYSGTGKCATARSPYRLPLAEPLAPNARIDALAQTGARCALIGQTICTTPPTTILHIKK